MKAIKRTPIAQVSGVIIAGLLMSTPVLAAQSNSIEVTAENFTHAETARNYRNWASKGATQEFVKMQGFTYLIMLEPMILNQQQLVILHPSFYI